MTRPRMRATELARLLNRFARPAYVLDDLLVIRFCNEPCLEWLGEDAAKLVGHRCAYQSPPIGSDPMEVLACGLCPPPAVLSGHPVSGTVGFTDTSGIMHRRHARFIPVGLDGEEPLAVIALVEATDLDGAAFDDETLKNGALNNARSESISADETASIGLFAPEPDADELHDRIRCFRQEAAGRYRADRLLGENPAMRLARRRIELAAASRTNVLVVGPAGSGRRHVAHAIHYASDPHRQGTLIPLACSALGSDLILSTLHALATNPLGPQAAQSTLLLAEADKLPIDIQQQVAGILEATSFLPRVVATAEVGLDSLVARGEYQAALSALLGTIVIRLPALADRREDIPLLAQMGLEEANARGAKQIGGFSPETLDKLDAYHWPGNLDELLAVVAAAHQHARGPQIETSDLPNRLRQAADAATYPRREKETIDLDAFLAEIERELIQKALAQAKGNKTKAATLLGMTRPRLYRRLVQLGLEEAP